MVLSVRRVATSILCLSALAIASCDPGVHLAYRKNFDQPIDPACIERALTTISANVQRTAYVSDGMDTRGFGRGTKVTQFLYPDPLNAGMVYTLDVAKLRNGKTGYYHGWGKLGTDITPDEQAEILPLLERANNAVAQVCGLSFAGTEAREGAG